MAGARGNQAQFGLAKQTAKDFPNTAYTDLLPFSGGNIAPSRSVDNLSETDASRDQGVTYLQNFGVEGSPEVYVRDANIHHILEAALGTLGTSGSGPYVHTVTPANALPYYSMYRDLGGLLWEQFSDCKVSELTISADAGAPLTAALTVMGRQSQRLTAAPADTDEVKTVTLTGTPTGGTFTLTFMGQTTAPIAYDAVDTDVQAAVEALSNVVSAGGTFTPGGGPLPGTGVTLTGATGFAALGLDPMSIDTSGLTGGTTPAGTVVTTTQGATDLPTLASGAVYNYNEASVVLGGAATAQVGSFELGISNNVTSQQTDDAKFYDIVEGKREVTLGFQLIFEDIEQYALFHYGSTSGTDQSSALATTSAVFTFSKGASNSISFTLPSLAYSEFPAEPNPNGDPVTIDVKAVAQRGASPVVTASITNAVAS